MPPRLGPVRIVGQRRFDQITSPEGSPLAAGEDNAPFTHTFIVEGDVPDDLFIPPWINLIPEPESPDMTGGHRSVTLADTLVVVQSGSISITWKMYNPNLGTESTIAEGAGIPFGGRLRPEITSSTGAEHLSAAFLVIPHVEYAGP